jgi:PhnB protein
MSVRPIPEGYHSITPYLTVPGVARLLDFLREAFGAEQQVRMDGPDGRVMHAEVRIGDSMLMMGEPQGDAAPMPASLYLYVPDVDSIYARALAAGAVSISEPATQFYGDRHGAVKDPCGNQWWIATHVEDVPSDEMERRAAAAMKG